jgi:hypothetical protein
LEVRRLKRDLSDLEADMALIESTPDERWNSSNNSDDAEADRKKGRKTKK